MANEGVSRLLVVDDDTELCVALGAILQQHGYSIAFEQDGLAGLKRALNEPFDLLILDVMLPGLDGFAALDQLRKASAVPVLMLSARGEKEDRVRGLRLGADDYLAKPFDLEELLARLRAILRRTSPTPARMDDPLRVAELRLFSGAHEAYLGDERLNLTAMECEILEQLMRMAGRPVSRDQLSYRLYNRAASPYDRAIDTHISRIRRKMGESGSMILSVRGTGYQLRVPAAHEGP